MRIKELERLRVSDTPRALLVFLCCSCVALVLLLGWSRVIAETAKEPTPGTYSYKHKRVDAKEFVPNYQIQVAIARVRDNTLAGTEFGERRGGESGVLVTERFDIAVTSKEREEVRNTDLGFNKAVRLQLLDALQTSGWYEVVEREDINAIIREIQFGKSDYVLRSGAEAKGKILMPDHIANGILAFNRRTGAIKVTRRDETGLEDLLHSTAADAEKERLQRKYTFLLRLYATKTAKVIATGHGYGDTAADAVIDAVNDLNSGIGMLLPEVRVKAIDGDMVVLSGGKTAGLYEGLVFYLVHQRGPRSPRDYRNRRRVGMFKVVEATQVGAKAEALRYFAGGKPQVGDLLIYRQPGELRQLYSPAGREKKQKPQKDRDRQLKWRP